MQRLLNRIYYRRSDCRICGCIYFSKTINARLQLDRRYASNNARISRKSLGNVKPSSPKLHGCFPCQTRESGVLLVGNSEAVGEPAGLSLRGFQQSAGDSPDRGSFGKSLGYRVERDWSEVWRIEDREDRLPPLRVKFRFKRVQPIKVV